ncbi:MAG: nucleotidyl transferase AbiEii/AbiGii toxin family protein [Proteobacteria bacterium]|nr:nucleotidyl transferase AbiEii/AbiGii toxin family protein [Pseudomonadota bacterium]
MDKAYIDLVRVLLESAPAIFATRHFAMKGGTAINLFIETMPRLSVDIDVVYADFQAPRDEALKSIASGLEAARKQLAKYGLEAEVSATKVGDEIKLFIRRDRNQVKVEVNHVFRGTVLPVETRRLGGEARKLFTTDLSVPVLATAELYGSKLVAAMDRQHPRDLFDVRGLFERGGLTPEVVECFVCYLAGHNRPVHEVLFSRDQDMSLAFENEFVGMTRIPVTLAGLEQVRRKLKAELPAALTVNHRQFLLGLVAGEPDWSLVKCPHLSQLPAIRWKLKNLAKLKQSNPGKFARQAEELRVGLDGGAA